jgi:hypothetical protein
MRRTMLMILLLASGCAFLKPKPPPVTLRFHEQADASLPETHIRVAYVPGTQQRIIVDPFAQLTERDVLEARLVSTPGGQAVLLKFDLHGANLLSEMTTRMRGRYVVVFVDEEPVAAVLVEQRITNGQFLLEPDLTDDKIRALVDNLSKIAGKKKDFGDTKFAP